jgi:anaerobic magnesium-protoporphyrin IX monomethyl ester cyclase
MNITVLEHPRIPSKTHFNDIANTPLWSCLMAGYAAAALRERGMAVSLLDARRRGFDDTAREILGDMPVLLCIHAVYFWEETPRLFDFVRMLRELGFSGHINLFGFFPTLAWTALLSTVPDVDSIAVGECETTLCELAERLSAGKPWRQVPGIACSHGNGSGLAAQRMPAADPDRFPHPDRTMAAGETVSVLASRGCYNHCRFCPIPAFNTGGVRWRGRRPEKIIEEITELKAKGGEDFYFVDPNFIGPGRSGKRRVLELARLLRPLGITFGMETRANDLDEELMAYLRSAGLQSLLIGIESGSPDVLGKLNKGASIRTGEQAIEYCRAAGIEPEIGFLMFVPDCTVDDLAANLAFLKRNRLLDRLDRTANLLCHRQIVFMGTSGYQQFEAQGRVTAAGCFGFQARIRYLDDRVEWIARVMGHACLLVLEQTGLPDSPLFWEKQADWRRAMPVNDYLVSLFEKLIAQVKTSAALPPAEHLNQGVARDILALIRAIARKYH